MSMSDCEKCWETPCTCGFSYRDWKVISIVSLFVAILSWRSKEEETLILEKVNYIINKNKRGSKQ